MYNQPLPLSPSTNVKLNLFQSWVGQFYVPFVKKRTVVPTCCTVVVCAPDTGVSHSLQTCPRWSWNSGWIGAGLADPWPLGDHIKVCDVMALATANCHHRCKDKDLQIELSDEWVNLSSHTGASWQSSINESFLRLVHTSQWSFLQCRHFGSFQLPSSVSDEGSGTHTLCRSCCYIWLNTFSLPPHSHLTLTTHYPHSHHLSPPLPLSYTGGDVVLSLWQLPAEGRGDSYWSMHFFTEGQDASVCAGESPCAPQSECTSRSSGMNVDEQWNRQECAGWCQQVRGGHWLPLLWGRAGRAVRVARSSLINNVIN